MCIRDSILQRLTTRQPDDSQIEVAISAMEAAIAADTGQEYVVRFNKLDEGDSQTPPLVD